MKLSQQVRYTTAPVFEARQWYRQAVRVKLLKQCMILRKQRAM
jgi:hypothetical protein